MQVLECADDLYDVALHFDFIEFFPAFEQFVEGLRKNANKNYKFRSLIYLIGAKFKQDIHILLVLEHMFKVDDVSVVQRFMDLDL